MMNTTQLTENWLNATMKSQRLEKGRDKYRALVAQAARALKRTGIIGIYAEFTDLADAIDQMGSYVKELQAERDALKARLETTRAIAEQCIDALDDEARAQLQLLLARWLRAIRRG